MMTIAARSSMIARASKKIFKATATRVPNNASNPIANAMSVAAGIAQPLSSEGL